MIDRSMRVLLGNRIYGCGRLPCRLPLEQVRKTGARGKACRPRRSERSGAGDLLALDDAGFRALFAVRRSSASAGTASSAIAWSRPAIRAAGDDQHALRLSGDSDPVVAATAIWALWRLSGPEAALAAALAAPRPARRRWTTNCTQSGDLNEPSHLGAGYSGRAIAAELKDAFPVIHGTTRSRPRHPRWKPRASGR